MGVKARLQEWLISVLERRYSGIREVVGLIDKVRERVENQEIKGLQDKVEQKKETDETDESIFKPEDGKWRPVVGTLGLIYKLQKVSDDGWYDNQNVFMEDKEKATDLMDLIG